MNIMSYCRNRKIFSFTLFRDATFQNVLHAQTVSVRQTYVTDNQHQVKSEQVN